MSEQRYYTEQEVHDIVEAARGCYRAWTTLPPRLIAVAMQRLGMALGEVEAPSNGNGHKREEPAVCEWRPEPEWACDT